MKNNHMQCSAGLQLLTKLLDFEFNRDADIYIQVFAKETALQLYKELKLGKNDTYNNFTLASLIFLILLEQSSHFLFLVI